MSAFDRLHCPKQACFDVVLNALVALAEEEVPMVVAGFTLYIATAPDCAISQRLDEEIGNATRLGGDS